MPTVGISLGSNLGDRLKNLSEAIHRVRHLQSSRHLLVSPVYETEPIDCPPGTPSFLNAVIEFETNLTPLILLDETQRIENEMGRDPDREKNAPRQIDLDLLYYDRLRHNSEDLSIPHPKMYDREFVLRPLADIRPDLVSEEMIQSAKSSGSAVSKTDFEIRVRQLKPQEG